MERLTGLGKTILATNPDEIRLDRTVKNILAYKPLLARILRETVSECRGMSYDEVEACIEGEVQVSEVYVSSGLSNASERINGSNTEDYLNDEGLIKYDIRTYLRLPCQKEPAYVKLIINVEVNNEDKPRYDLQLRALFYCCRMISSQEGVEFTTDTDDPVKYGNIKKVYSIWICPDTARKRANSIEKYSINRSFLTGHNDDRPRYDILNAVIIYLSDKSDHGVIDNELISMLTDLFDKTLNGVDKIRKLKEDHDLKVTREVETEVNDMCTYAAAIRKEGIEQGIEKGIEQGIEQGISIFIEDKIDDGVPRETVRERLMKRFHLNEEKAEEYLLQYAPV